MDIHRSNVIEPFAPLPSSLSHSRANNVSRTRVQHDPSDPTQIRWPPDDSHKNQFAKIFTQFERDNANIAIRYKCEFFSICSLQIANRLAHTQQNTTQHTQTTIRRDWFYFILQPKAGLTHIIEIQCINQCYTKLRPHN